MALDRDRFSGKPPFFVGLDYTYWKMRMEVFLRAQGNVIWQKGESS